MRKIHMFYVVSAILLFSFLLKYISPTFIDSDTYFILATGREIMEHGVPYENPFHITSGLGIVVQQWLYNVLCYGIYGVGNFHGLFIMTIILVILNGIMYWKIARLKKSDSNIAVLLTLLFFILYSEFITVRPTYVTTLLLLIQVYLVEKYVQTNKLHWIVWLPLIMIVEANMHIALWFMHILFMLPYIVPPFHWNEFKFKKVNYKVGPLIIISVVMCAVTIVNPYGMDGVLYLINSYTSQLQSAGIYELQPTQYISSMGIMLLYGAIIVVFAKANHKKVSSPFLYLFLGTYILGMLSYRNNIYFSMAFLLVLFELLGQIDFSSVHALLRKVDIKICVLMLLLAGFGVYGIFTEYYKEQDSLTTSVKAVEYLNKNADKTDKIFTGFNSGAYVEWNGYKVYMEARPELYFEAINKKEDIFQEYMNIVSSTSFEEYRKFDEKYDFHYYLLDKSSILNTHLSNDNAFEIVLETEEYQLWKRD